MECPLHASKFDLRTGAVDAPPAKLPVRTHEVVDRRRHDLRPAVHGRPQPAALHRARLAGVPREDRRRRRRLAGRPVGRALAARAGLRRAAGRHRRRTAPPVRQAAAVQGVPGRRRSAKPISRWRRTARTCGAEWLLGVRAAGLDRADRAVRLADGTRGPSRRLRHRDRRRRAHPARRRRPRPASTPCAPSTTPAPCGTNWPAGAAGRDRRRVHRRRGRLHRSRLGLDVTVVEAAPTPLAGAARRRPWAPSSPRLHADHGVRLFAAWGSSG